MLGQRDLRLVLVGDRADRLVAGGHRHVQLGRAARGRTGIAVDRARDRGRVVGQTRAGGSALGHPVRAGKDACEAGTAVARPSLHHGSRDLEVEAAGVGRRSEVLRHRDRRGCLPEDVGGACVLVAGHVHGWGAGGDEVARDGDRAAEVVLCQAVRGRQLRRLRATRPTPGRLDEHVSGAAVDVARVCVRRAGDDRVSREGDRTAELVACRAVRGSQLGSFGLVRPASGRLDEDVRGALVGMARDVCAVDPATTVSPEIATDRPSRSA